MLYNKWWGKDQDTLFCPKRESDLTKASALNLVNIGGIFVVLLCGLSIALMVRFNPSPREYCVFVYNIELISLL